DAFLIYGGFFILMPTGMRFMQIQMAASLAGLSALSTGMCDWITSPQARQVVQGYRAHRGGILSTRKSVLGDISSLIVRWDYLRQCVQAH
ncbi:dihydrofolate reductase family protein, partial [Vibrio parahaemolyticus]|uniref:dihydrofolate reductase family protein n=1 Tax=Vibrio parahaemolyticus TaxID=670 RepID=UPI0021146ED1